MREPDIGSAVKQRFQGSRRVRSSSLSRSLSYEYRFDPLNRTAHRSPYSGTYWQDSRGHAGMYFQQGLRSGPTSSAGGRSRAAVAPVPGHFYRFLDRDVAFLRQPGGKLFYHGSGSPQEFLPAYYFAHHEVAEELPLCFPGFSPDRRSGRTRGGLRLQRRKAFQIKPALLH